MATVNIEVNKRSFRVNCDEGQEEHLQELGKYIDLRISQLKGAGVQTSDINMLLLAALLITDELTDAKNSLDGAGSGGQPAGPNGSDAHVAETLNTVAQRIEDIAGRLSSD